MFIYCSEALSVQLYCNRMIGVHSLVTLLNYGFEVRWLFVGMKFRLYVRLYILPGKDWVNERNEFRKCCFIAGSSSILFLLLCAMPLIVQWEKWETGVFSWSNTLHTVSTYLVK